MASARRTIRSRRSARSVRGRSCHSARGGAVRVPGLRALRAARRAGRAPQRLPAGDGEDDRRTARARAATASERLAARVREPGRRQRRGVHARARGAGRRFVAAWPIQAPLVHADASQVCVGRRLSTTVGEAKPSPQPVPSESPSGGSGSYACVTRLFKPIAASNRCGGPPDALLAKEVLGCTRSDNKSCKRSAPGG
jgi:hypothetical protein